MFMNKTTTMTLASYLSQSCPQPWVTSFFLYTPSFFTGFSFSLTLNKARSGNASDPGRNPHLADMAQAVSLTDSAQSFNLTTIHPIQFF